MHQFQPLSLGRAGHTDTRYYRTLAFGLVVCFVAQFSGCSVIKGVLKPVVCDCPETRACPADPVQDSQVVEQVPQRHDAKPDSHTPPKPNLSVKPRSTSPSLNPKEDPSEPTSATSISSIPANHPDPGEVAPKDVRVTIVPADRGSYPSLRKAYRIPKLQADQVLYKGDFSRRPGDEVLVFAPGRELMVFTPKGKLATLPLGDAQDIQTEPLNISAFQIIDPVHDGPLEIQILSAVNQDANQDRIDFVIVKCIGRSLAEVFRKPIAERSHEELDIIATVEFIGGQSHAKIRYAPKQADHNDKKYNLGQIYEWNPWEGMFRRPRTTPTSERTRDAKRQPAIAPTPNSNAVR